MFEQILQEIKKAGTIIIHRHRNPDGDALGSQEGLRQIIRDNFPDKKVYAVGDSSKRYSFILSQDLDVLEDSVWENALAIILDTSSENLISDDRYRKAARTARIDHHLFLGQIAGTEVVDPSYESCCGLVTELAIEQGLDVSKAAASALYAGTVTDSGRFRYDSTSEGTFRRVSFLLRSKPDIEGIYSRLYVTSIEELRLKAWFIDHIRFTENNAGYLYITESELKELGLPASAASRGYVNTMSDLEGVKVWAAFAESPEGVLCELRSSSCSINPIAVKYGGGGHAKASGATVKDRQTAMAMLEDLDRHAKENR